MKCKSIIMAATLLLAATATMAKSPTVAPSYAWTILPPLGLHEPATIDTLLLNYYRQAIPSAVSTAYATTGNIAAPGLDMIFMDRKPTSDFFFRDAIRAWIPSLETQKFYNTRIPMTLLSYNFGGSRDTGQDRLKAIFSGNPTKQWQVGAMVDYIYSKGSYANQAAKDFTWGVSGSYMGDRYEMQAFMYHFNNLDMDNGGITDDLYITDPAELQGGTSSVDTKTIPTRLSSARSRVKGTQAYVNNRYKIGYWKEEQVDDTTVHRTYVPVTSIIYTLDFRENKHHFYNNNAKQAAEFWEHTYLNRDRSDDLNKYWSLRNTVGVSLLEGFHKYAKFGLSAYATYEHRRYFQTPYEFSTEPLAEGLDPFPYATAIPEKHADNLMWIGGQLTKQTGRILRYEATGQVGIMGAAAGDVSVGGNVSTRIPIRKDTLAVTGYASFRNEEAPYLLKQYVSNHFIWDNNFGKERRVRFGGKLDFERFGTHIDVGVENLQNYIYFDSQCLPVQHDGNVQVFSATLRQNLKAGILRWDNSITYQTSSRSDIIPLPQLAIYSNLYILFRVAKVLHVQLGLDCDYYTRYKAPSYQPATMTFYNQDEVSVGNYPFLNFYINMKLSKARFYLMMTHVNQGLFGGKGYFSMPHYPLNPRRFQLGVSVDFAN